MNITTNIYLYYKSGANPKIVSYNASAAKFTTPRAAASILKTMIFSSPRKKHSNLLTYCNTGVVVVNFEVVRLATVDNYPSSLCVTLLCSKEHNGENHDNFLSVHSTVLSFPYLKRRLFGRRALLRESAIKSPTSYIACNLATFYTHAKERQRGYT
jgi:hypothetical protein